MSSLTALGINKNKKGFAPKIAKRKPKARPAAATPSTALPTENDTIDMSITSNYTVDESVRVAAHVGKRSPHHPSSSDDLGLTQEEMEMNALASRKRRQSANGAEAPSISRKRNPSAPYYPPSAPSPYYASSPISAPSPKAPIIDKPDCAFGDADEPILKVERITPGPISSTRKSMSRPLKDDEEADLADAKKRLAAAPVSSSPSSPYPTDSRSPSPPPAPRTRKNNGKQKATDDVDESSRHPPPTRTRNKGKQKVIVEYNDDDDEDELSPSPPPAPRKNKGKQKATTDEDEDFEPRAAPKKKITKKPSMNKRATRFKTVAPKTAGSSIGIPSVSSSSGKPISIGVPSAARESDDDSDDSSSSPSKRRSRINGRNVPKKYAFRLPENLKTLDDITNDPAKLENLDKSMASFTKDIDGIVSKSFKEMETNRYNALKKLEDVKNMSEEELAAIKKKEEEEKGLQVKKKQIAKEKEEERRKREQDGQVLAESSNALQVRLINGQIVLDTDSLTVERREHEQDYGDGAMEVVEENAMSRRVNSQTYSKRKQSSRWDEVETAQFYDCISQFGTDFEMISMVMPGRTRAQIRTKFNREERLHPGKITDYLIRKRKPLDMAKYEELAGIQLETVPEDFHEMQLA